MTTEEVHVTVNVILATLGSVCFLIAFVYAVLGVFDSREHFGHAFVMFVFGVFLRLLSSLF
jgi:1,4-dihydroxy-2-naphthoate octaprenyltransferase